MTRRGEGRVVAAVKAARATKRYEETSMFIIDVDVDEGVVGGLPSEAVLSYVIRHMLTSGLLLYP